MAGIFDSGVFDTCTFDSAVLCVPPSNPGIFDSGIYDTCIFDSVVLCVPTQDAPVDDVDTHDGGSAGDYLRIRRRREKQLHPVIDNASMALLLLTR